MVDLKINIEKQLTRHDSIGSNLYVMPYLSLSIAYIPLEKINRYISGGRRSAKRVKQMLR